MSIMHVLSESKVSECSLNCPKFRKCAPTSDSLSNCVCQLCFKWMTSDTNSFKNAFLYLFSLRTEKYLLILLRLFLSRTLYLSLCLSLSLYSSSLSPLSLFSLYFSLLSSIYLSMYYYLSLSLSLYRLLFVVCLIWPNTIVTMTFWNIQQFKMDIINC